MPGLCPYVDRVEPKSTGRFDHLLVESEPRLGRRTARTLPFLQNGPGPGLVAKAVLEIAASESPRLRNVVGQQAKVVKRLRRFLPDGASGQGVGRTFRLDRE